jgi:hypothetical protein
VIKFSCVLGALSALLFSLSSRAASFEETCQALPASPLITVSLIPVTVADTILDDDMQSMTIRTTGAESLHELATVGTTFANRVWELSYGLNMIADRDSGRVCYRPAIHVAVGYDPMRISVARPFHSGTCAYDVIVAHEREHVRIYNNFLPMAAESIEQSVRSHLSRKVRYASSAEAANADMRQVLRSEVSGVVKDEMAKSQALHSQFDSIEESLHMLNSCNGEIQRGLQKEVLAWK